MALNIPNTLSVVRILLTPVFVICLLRDMFPAAIFVFLLAGISDALDGLFARYLNQRTLLGAYLDPIADKILLMSAFICLAVLEKIPPWLAVVVISRDIIIVVGYAISEITDTRHRIRVKPSIASKCTTVAQLFTVLWVLVNPDISTAPGMRKFLYLITSGLTIVSGLHYIYIGMNILQNSED